MSDSNSLTDGELKNTSIKSLASIAAVLGMASGLHGHAHPRSYNRPEPTAEDRLRAKQKKASRGEINKRRKQKHR